MQKDSRIYVAGHTGLVGSTILDELRKQGYENLVTKSRDNYDLCDQEEVENLFRHYEPEYVFLCAARVGGIIANDTYPAEFIYENLAIQTNVIHAAHKYGVKKLLFLGSSCIYPKMSPQPICEHHLLSGPLEPTNQWYAIAKIAGLMMCQAYAKQYNCNFISAMPTNLYGPRDNFDPQTSHVIPALIRKFHQAKIHNVPSVTLWGSGTPRREFLHVTDLARACIHLMLHYNDPAPINVGSGMDYAISEIAQAIALVADYIGEIKWDTSKPDGTPRKLLNSDRMLALGWKPEVELLDGLRDTYEHFVKSQL